MKNKLIASIAVTAILFGAGGYYVGTKSGTSQTSARGATFAGRAGGATGARFVGGGAVFGTIVSKDATSITVQLVTGTSTTSGSGSKIVLYDSSTQIGKTVTGSPSDLAVGTSITVAGTANSDGSVTAQSIQVRPAGTGRPTGGQ